MPPSEATSQKEKHSLLTWTLERGVEVGAAVGSLALFQGMNPSWTESWQVALEVLIASAVPAVIVGERELSEPKGERKPTAEIGMDVAATFLEGLGASLLYLHRDAIGPSLGVAWESVRPYVELGLGNAKEYGPQTWDTFKDLMVRLGILAIGSGLLVGSARGVKSGVRGGGISRGKEWLIEGGKKVTSNFIRSIANIPRRAADNVGERISNTRADVSRKVLTRFDIIVSKADNFTSKKLRVLNEKYRQKHTISTPRPTTDGRLPRS